MVKYEDEKEDEKCFVATAAYGTPMAEEIDILRQFRNNLLLPNPPGKAFVAVYYKLGPSIAKFISKHQAFRTVVRKCFVAPVVASVRLFQSR